MPQTNKTVAKAHHLLNCVSQDSCIASGVLLESPEFYELLLQRATMAEDTENDYNVLMSFIADNY